MIEALKKPTAIVITPTIGKTELSVAIESVLNQTFQNLIHLIIVDGEIYHQRAHLILDGFGQNDTIRALTLPFNTGKDNFYGHRIYAAFSFLVEADYVFFLDEDNWYDSNHVESLINLIESENLDWAFSLRKIVDHRDCFVANDDCESLGNWPPYSGMGNLVDSSCYAIKKEILWRVGHGWLDKFAADRTFYHILSNFSEKYQTSSQYTLNYKLQEGKKPDANFFINGNQFMMTHYNHNLPWQKEILTLPNKRRSKKGKSK